jgi:hypothetical protein
LFHLDTYAFSSLITVASFIPCYMQGVGGKHGSNVLMIHTVQTA